MKPFSNRIIVWTEIPSMSRQSFGLIVICETTRRTLLVQMKDSPEFLHFARGFFRKSDIPSILLCCTENEHNLIRQICDCEPSKRRSVLENILRERFSEEQISKFLDTSLRRISDDIASIKEGLLSISPQENHYWLWPKGGINKEESPIDCAIRETREESGVEISKDQISFDYGSLSVESISFFGSTFKTCYYVAFVDSEIESKDFDVKEISKVEWVSLDEAKKRVSLNYSKLVDEIKKIVQRRLNAEE